MAGLTVISSVIPARYLSSSCTWRVFQWSCSGYAMCWYWHPPHFWKSGHFGVTRCVDGSMIVMSSASEQFFLLLMMRALMVSPGMVKGMNTTQSVSPCDGTSIRATPSPWLESA